MQIKLYPESGDTRPIGSYEFVCSAYVSPFGILFVSQTGTQILSSLRYKLTLDPGDSIVHNIVGQTYEVTGVTKKHFVKLAQQAREESNGRTTKSEAAGGSEAAAALRETQADSSPASKSKPKSRPVG